MRRTFAKLVFGLAMGACALGIWWDLSWFSLTLALGFAVLSLAFGRRSRRGWLVALMLLSGPLVVRGLFARGGAWQSMTVLPADSGVRWVNTLVPERDGVVVAAGFMQLANLLRDEQGAHFRTIMRDAYARSDAASSWLPTPAIATYLGLQAPSAFDVVEIGVRDPRGAVIFLHGYAGNFYVYCWELAQAARSAKLLTVCPSVSWRGDWWSERGEQTFRNTLSHLRSRGIQRVYLAGLSNGGAGASVIAHRHERDLAGLVLISGTRGSPVLGLPTLMIQGASDRMMGVAQARSYARKSKRVRYRELPGGHLIFLSDHQRVRPLIAAFLRELEGSRPARGRLPVD
ncbi:MAG TPA: hypothetical protein VI299_02070 [Polyangiales bacterium]